MRKEQQSKRYTRARLATRLTQGRYGSRYAKVVAEEEQSLLADMVGFAELQSASFDTPELWTKDGSKTKSLIDQITDFQNNSVTQIFCKTNSFTESLMHAKWIGAMARLEQRECVQSPDTLQVFLSECLFPHDVGACFWLMCMLKNHWCYGPNAWPMLGLRGFARSHNSTGVVLQRVRSCRIDRLGENFGDGHGYEIDRQTFGSLISGVWHCCVGPVWIRLYTSALQTQKSKTTADMVHEVAFVWHMTIFNKSFFKNCPKRFGPPSRLSTTSISPERRRSQCGRRGRTFSQSLLFSRTELLL